MCTLHGRGRAAGLRRGCGAGRGGGEFAEGERTGAEHHEPGAQLQGAQQTREAGGDRGGTGGEAVGHRLAEPETAPAGEGRATAGPGQGQRRTDPEPGQQARQDQEQQPGGAV
ncbi:hypothetical protein WKI65_25320 [Streptomyces sp. MS1.AVA.3]|uniref:hypothetical protein n=1 Tax=Streptomyces decoyicus TaxID=249567 RepID=UPI0030BBB021